MQAGVSNEINDSPIKASLTSFAAIDKTGCFCFLLNYIAIESKSIQRFERHGAQKVFRAHWLVYGGNLHVLGFASYVRGWPHTCHTVDVRARIWFKFASGEHYCYWIYIIKIVSRCSNDLLWGKAARAKIHEHNMLNLWLIRYSNFSSILREDDWQRQTYRHVVL